MNLFVCSTAYQLLNAISIAIQDEEPSDLIIIRESVMRTCDIDYLKSMRCFSDVYAWTELLERVTDEQVHDKKDALIRGAHILETIIQKKKIWKTLPNLNKRYSTVYVGYMDLPTRSIYDYFKRKGSRLGLYDEGTYTYSCLEIPDSAVKKAVYGCLYGGVSVHEAKEIYIRNPERLRVGAHTDIKIRKIETPIGDQYGADILRVYKVQQDRMHLLDSPVIVFDQNLEANEMRKIQRRIAETCCSIFETENVLVKLHPASRNADYPQDCRIYADRVPFEAVMQAYSMENKVLLSVFSTTCFAPKQTMNQEPYVLFTYKLMESYFHIDSKYLQQIDELRNDYADKSKVLVPRSFEELEEMLRAIQAKRGR